MLDSKHLQHAPTVEGVWMAWSLGKERQNGAALFINLL